MTPVVKDAYDPDHSLSLVVQADECLADVLKRFTDESWVKGLFVGNPNSGHR